jgi:hypothetical protein
MSDTEGITYSDKAPTQYAVDSPQIIGTMQGQNLPAETKEWDSTCYIEAEPNFTDPSFPMESTYARLFRLRSL